jgi:hypothetical protein
VNSADLELLEAWAERWRIKWAIAAGARLAAMDRGDSAMVEQYTAELKELVEEKLSDMIARYPSKTRDRE